MQEQWTFQVSQRQAEKIRASDIPTVDRIKVEPDYAARHLPVALTNAAVLLGVLDDDVVHDVTAFYSRTRPGLTSADLEERAEFDTRAREAAEAIGGLKIYYPGDRVPNLSHINPDLGFNFAPDAMSFCIWDSHEQAKAGAAVTAHGDASERTSKWYEGFGIKKYDVWTQPVKGPKGKTEQLLVFQSKPLQRA